MGINKIILGAMLALSSQAFAMPPEPIDGGGSGSSGLVTSCEHTCVFVCGQGESANTYLGHVKPTSYAYYSDVQAFNSAKAACDHVAKNVAGKLVCPVAGANSTEVKMIVAKTHSVDQKTGKVISYKEIKTVSDCQ
jgi:hypothetical protein